MKILYLADIKKMYEKASDENAAVAMRKYMKDNFNFFGISSPERKEIYKVFFKKNGLPILTHLPEIVSELWEMPEREYQYFGMTLVEKMKKNFQKENIHIFENMIIEKSWWDTVDFIAANIAGPFFRKYPEMTESRTKIWMSSNNMWLQRSVLLFQLKYRYKIDENLLYKTIDTLKDSKEFFIQKAIGWALREYSKTYPERVISFVKTTELASLSQREALKVINGSDRSE